MEICVKGQRRTTKNEVNVSNHKVVHATLIIKSWIEVSGQHNTKQQALERHKTWGSRQYAYVPSV